MRVVPPGAGEIIGDSADRRVEILSDDESLNATWSRFGPHREGADLHVHHHHTDFFYVLDGELTVRLGIDDEPVLLRAGMLARVPPLVVHGFRNGSDGEVRYLNFHAPGREFAEYLRAMRDGRTFAYDQHPPPTEGGRPTTEAAFGEVTFAAEHSGSRTALLADVDEMGIAETATNGARLAPPLHVHHRHVESFYVLDGAMTFTVAGREIEADAGTWVQVPPGVPHTFYVANGRVRFLDIHTPSCGFGAFLRALHDARSDEELEAARAAFDQRPA